MGKVLNFDLFMQEKQKETVSVTIFGKEYNVPCEIPAVVPVMMARAEDSIDAQASTKMVMRAADAMFGKANVDEMCEKGMSSANLANLVKQLFETINGSDEDDEEEEISDEDSRTQTGEGRHSKK